LIMAAQEQILKTVPQAARCPAWSRDTRAGRLDFITSLPQDVYRGSGCFVGIQTLAKGLAQLDCDVEMIAPQRHLPALLLERVVFNEYLRWHTFRPGAITVGFDADAYSVARRRHPHVASIKGVIADVIPFERGAAKASVILQGYLEKLHARQSDLVITPSRYCAERLDELYGVRNAVVIPELIDLGQWHDLLRRAASPSTSERFTVLCVCRFYARKRVDLLLRAAAILRGCIPELEIRIVGGGMEEARLRSLWRELRLESVVKWVGNATQCQLAAEYRRADAFCLPSLQEGFGIVFLEAMAAGKPIIAARSAAVPEVVQHGLLVEPDNAEALAAAIETLYFDSGLRMRLGADGLQAVQQFEMQRVALSFLNTVSRLLA
jgi:glycosyltransferase involved in cell wall biosynthesis